MTLKKTKKFHQVLICVAAACVLVLLVSEARSAIIMKNDGTYISGVFDREQSITLQTSAGETSIKLSEVRWMAGSDPRKLRVSGLKTLLMGTLRDAQLTIQKVDKDKKKPISIPASEVAFLFGGDVDLDKTSEIRIEESGGDMRVLSYSKAKRKSKLEITLIPENWQGDIQMTEPSYREHMSNRDEFTITMMVRVGASTKADLDKMTSDPKAEHPSINLDYVFQGGKYWVTGPLELKLERDKTASMESYQQKLTKSFGKPFYMEFGNRVVHETSGSGFLNLYVNFGTESLASGQLHITKTLSNVLRLPITLEGK
jgi:hypothetical protein